MSWRLALVVVLVIGCASPPTPTTAGTVEQLPRPVTDLDPGTYTKSDFQPQLTFTLGDGWTAAQVTSGFFDIEQDPGSADVIAVQFARAAMTVGLDTADTIAADIESAPNIRVVERSAAIIDGRPTLRLVVETDDPADLNPIVFRGVMTIPAGPLSIASGRRLQIDLLDVHMGVLAVLVGGSIAEWDRTLELAQPVLDSVTINDF